MKGAFQLAFQPIFQLSCDDGFKGVNDVIQPFSKNNCQPPGRKNEIKYHTRYTPCVRTLVHALVVLR